MSMCNDQSQCQDGVSYCDVTTGKCAPCSIISYTPGPDLANLPSCMHDAVVRSRAGQQTTQDDANMGGLCQPNAGANCNGVSIIPYCKQDEFKNTSYCACANTGVAWTECIFAPCQGEELAYKNTVQRDTLKGNDCPSGMVICNNITQIGGEGNVATIYQNFNCGGIVQTFVNDFLAHPIIAIVLIILIFSMIILKPQPQERQIRSLPPPLLTFQLDN